MGQAVAKKGREAGRASLGGGCACLPPWYAGWGCLLFFASTPARALSENGYFEALRAVNQDIVDRKWEVDGPAARLRRMGPAAELFSAVSGPVQEESGVLSATRVAPTRVSKRWVVLAWRSDEQRAVPVKADPRHLESEPTSAGAGSLGVFRYSIGVEPSSSRARSADRLTLLVEPLARYGVRKVDPRVAELRLIADPTSGQREKGYTFLPNPRRQGGGADHSGSASAEEVRAIPSGEGTYVAVSPDGLRSGVTALEFFPLDLPRIERGRGRRIERLPELPAPMRAVAARAGFRGDTRRGLWFEEQDFFGRPIAFFWREGEPWPAYLKTTQGVAVLLEVGDERSEGY